MNFGSIRVARASWQVRAARRAAIRSFSPGGSGPSSNQSVLPTNSLPVSTGGTHIHITVNGPIVGVDGVEQLASLLNDAVAHRDVRLIATQVKVLTPLTR